MKPKKDLSSHYTQSTPNWCPGCGNFGIWVSLKNALQELKLVAHRVVLVVCMVGQFQLQRVSK